MLDHASPSSADSTGTRTRVLRAVIDLGPAVDLAEITAHVGGHPNGVRRHLDSLVSDEFVEAGKRSKGSSGRPAIVYSVTDAGRRADAAVRAPSTRSEVLALLTKTLAESSDGAERAREMGRQWGAEQAPSSEQALSSEQAPSSGRDPSREHSAPHELTAEGAHGNTPSSAAGLVFRALREQGFAPVSPNAEQSSEDAPDPLPDAEHDARVGAPGGRGAVGPGAEPGAEEIVLLACPIADAVHVDAAVACALHRGFLEGALGADGLAELVPFGSPRGCVVRVREGLGAREEREVREGREGSDGGAAGGVAD